MYKVKYRLLNDITRWPTILVSPRCCVKRIRLWTPKLEESSSVLIGAGGTWRSDWPDRAWAVGVCARGDRSEEEVNGSTLTTPLKNHTQLGGEAAKP